MSELQVETQAQCHEVAHGYWINGEINDKKFEDARLRLKVVLGQLVRALAWSARTGPIPRPPTDS